VPEKPYEQNLRYGPPVELGYARVSTAKQDLDRQIDALRQAGIAPERIYLDKKWGATADRPGLKAALEYARDGDVIVVHTLDRLGRTVRDTLNLIHELAERGVGVRNLADPIKVDSSNPADPMAQLAVVLLAQMERTYTLDRGVSRDDRRARWFTADRRRHGVGHGLVDICRGRRRQLESATRAATGTADASRLLIDIDYFKLVSDTYATSPATSSCAR
jgi:hypothetical protein